MKPIRLSFSKSAPTIDLLPDDTGCEIIFMGYSNVGKSSLINYISNVTGLAKCSKTPGRTQMFNVFDHTPDKRIIDLPGYGFSRVNKPMRLRWKESLQAYLAHRDCLKGIVLILDVRRSIRPIDADVLEWFEANELPVFIVLNKADKLPKHQVNAVQKIVMEAANLKPEDIAACSCTKKTGFTPLMNKIHQWLETS